MDLGVSDALPMSIHEGAESLQLRLDGVRLESADELHLTPVVLGR
jgi:hypothetical protein